MRNKPSRKLLSGVLAVALTLSVVVTGCSSGDSEDITAGRKGSQGAEEVAAKLKEKYGDTQVVDYAEGELAVERDHQFTISYDFDPIEAGLENYTQIASLYYDAELTQPVSSTYDWASEDKKSYTISPWEYPGRALLYLGNPDDFSYGVVDGSTSVFRKDDYTDWGNAGTMYLATQVDLSTGEPLDKPSVQVITVKGELETPKLSYEVTEDGVVQFSWNEVKGAEAYYITRMELDEEGKYQSIYAIAQTIETKWSSDAPENVVNDSVYSMNLDFDICTVSEDDWLSEPMVEAYKGQYDPKDGAVISADKENYYFGVIAVNEKGTSMYSNTCDIKDVAALAPNTVAYNMENLSEEGFSRYVKGVTMMPSHRWIVMCDGVLSQRLVNYDFEKVVEETEKWYNEKDDGTYESVSVDVLKVPFVVDGTAFSGTLVISEYDKGAWKEQLKSIEARQESLRSKTGDVKREIVTEDEKESDSSKEADSGKDAEPSKETDSDKDPEPSKESDKDSPKESGDIKTSDATVTANSALSEYLALNMISGNETVDLSEFPEARDQSYLIDAWTEAFYQNPLVLGVSEAAVSRDGKSLYLTYEDDQETRETKQKAITEKAEKVVDEIIDDGMSARDMEFAINHYLCETVTYDDDALLNAEKYDYMKVDSEYYDSFTAYGALVDGVGVCASYSAAFKLLADTAGLDSVVVTGYLDGSLGHAWNRVDLGNGQWATVDSTNNDIEIISNALLNAPDSAVATTLVEDDLWVMDSVLSDYSNESDENEFYHVSGLFFDQDKVVDEIVDQLSTNEIAVVRTDYALTDAQFYEIGGAAVEATGNANLSGCYWMGIVVITNDASLLQ